VVDASVYVSVWYIPQRDEFHKKCMCVLVYPIIFYIQYAASQVIKLFSLLSFFRFILILSTRLCLCLHSFLLHHYACFIFAYPWLPVPTGLSQGFFFSFLCWEGEWSRYYSQIDHACLLPNAYLHIVCDYLFISFKHNVCKLYNGDKSFSNQRNKLFSHVSSARKNCTSPWIPSVPCLYLVDLLSEAR